MSCKPEYVTPKDGILRVYANHAKLSVTAFDLRMIFGEVVDATPEVATVSQSVQITMSWLQAKLVVELLSRAIRAYEDKNGLLTAPELPVVAAAPVSLPEVKPN